MTEDSHRRSALIALSVVVMVAFGAMFYAYSVLLTDEAAGSEFSTSLLSTAYGGFVLVGGLLAVLVGRYADHHGVRRVIGLGTLLGAAGMALLSVAGSPLHVVAASWLLMGPAGAMLFYEPAFIAIDQWFTEHRRGRAIGILTVIAGLAGPVFVPLTGLLVTSLGWRPATRVLAVLVAVVGTIGTVVVPNEPGDAALDHGAARPTLRLLLKDRRFVVFTLSVILFYGSLQAVFFHRIAAFEEAGFAIGAVSLWAGVSGLLGFPGRWLAPRARGAHAARLLTAFLLVIAGSVVLVVIAGSTVVMVAHFALFGLAFGGLLPLRPVMMAEWYSGPRFGHIMGAQWSLAALSGAAGPWLVGIGRDAAGGYRWPLLAITVAFGFASILTLATSRAPRATKSSFR